MNTQDFNINSKNMEMTRNEISLRYLISILINNKFIIIIITTLFALVATIISKYFITPKYTTTFTIAANVPSTYSTRYGDFSSPINNNIDYINLIKSNEVLEHTIIDMGFNPDEITAESISNLITIEEVDERSNVFPITITGGNSQEILRLSDILYENYINYIDLLIKERAINHFHNDFTVKIETDENKLQSSTDMLNRYEKLLKNISPVVDQEAILNIISDGSQYIVLSEIVNPNYLQLEKDIFSTKETIEVLENKIQTHKIHLLKLTYEMNALEDHYANSSKGKLESDIVNMSDVFMLSNPVVSSEKSNPNILKNAVFAGILGTVLSLIIVYFKSYMRKEI